MRKNWREKNDAKVQAFGEDNSASNKVDLVGYKYDGKTARRITDVKNINSGCDEVVQTSDGLFETMSTVHRVDE